MKHTHALLQRIMGVKYSFPTNLHISRECLDMMSKIFVGNPANRISIAGIKSHPWFTKNLPDELKVSCVLQSSAAYVSTQLTAKVAAYCVLLAFVSDFCQ